MKVSTKGGLVEGVLREKETGSKVVGRMDDGAGQAEGKAVVGGRRGCRGTLAFGGTPKKSRK